MELLNIFKDYFFEVLPNSIFGLSFIEIILILFSLLFSIIIRGFFAKFIIFKIKTIIKKTGNKIDDHLFESLAPPLKILPIIFVIALISLFIDTESQLETILEKINRTFVTVFIFWLFHQSLVPLSHILKKLEELLSQALVDWLIKSLKYLIIFLGVVAILETWGIKIGPIIAGLGLFGVAVALGAQDLFKNLISGILIILEKRFQLGDIIEVPGHATGTVEYIGFRSTLIRLFDTTSISLPNYVFSDTAILNYSDRHYRRIKWIIGLTYDTSTEQLKNICQEIENYISSNENFIINDKYSLFVRIDKFNDSSIDILIYTFTTTNEWDKYLLIKQDLAYSIKSIVQKNQSNFAFPSQSIYIEKN